MTDQERENAAEIARLKEERDAWHTRAIAAEHEAFELKSELEKANAACAEKDDVLRRLPDLYDEADQRGCTCGSIDSEHGCIRCSKWEKADRLANKTRESSTCGTTLLEELRSLRRFYDDHLDCRNGALVDLRCFYEKCLKTEGIHDHSVILQTLRRAIRDFKAKHETP